MIFTTLLFALVMLDEDCETLSPAEQQQRREKARRLAMMQRPALGLAPSPV